MSPSLKSQILRVVTDIDLEKHCEILYEPKMYDNLVILEKARMSAFVSYSKNIWRNQQKNA